MPRAGLLIALLPALSAGAADLAGEARAILERRCLSCHGPSNKTAGLDLSTRESALKGGIKGPALQPGTPAQSLLLARVRKQEMPPAAPLPDSEIQTLDRWIAAGAAWDGALGEGRAGRGWWSLQPLRVVDPPTPVGGPEAWSRSAIDRWIYSNLRKNGLTPSPPADRRALIRRLSFDLIGLPPSPEEIESFVHDSNPGAYERLVDRLLASPHYGERWARHWLDVVRFAESEGFERDWLRDHAWRYRDYVIRSFNQDKPYDQFAREQIAGDVLEPVTRDGIVATGLLVLGPFDAVGLTSAVAQERAAVREDQLEEMLGVVSQTFLGLTVNCARCHDHKFDPIPQKDYYRLKAVFEGVLQPTTGEELRADGRPLVTPREAKAREERLAPIRSRIGELEASLGALYRSARPPVVPAGMPAPIAQWRFDTDARDDFGDLHASLTETAELTSGRLRPAKDKETVTLATPPLSFDVREKTLEAWVHVRKLPEKSAAVLRLRNRAGFRGAAFDGIQYVPGEKNEKKQWENMSTARFRSADSGAPPEEASEGELLHIAIVYSADDTIRIYRNGSPHGKPYKPEVNVPAGRLQSYIRDDAVVELTASKEFELEQARLYNVALTPAQVASCYAAGAVSQTAEDLVATMTPVAREHVERLRQDLAQARDALKSVAEPQKAFAADIQPPEPTYILDRGDVNKKGELVAPGAISAIAGMSNDLGLSASAPEAERRRKLAEWIAGSHNPLFARVIVNRVWQHHFGAGLIENPNDFGFNGGLPSHPELLDWLAGELIRGGWSLKKLHHLVVTSEAYRQSSQNNPAAAKIDTGNRLLWRYSPQRLEAEVVRDAILAVSGKLNPEMYGPSFRPFQVVKNPGSYHIYDPVDSDDPGLHRRTVYRMSVNSGGNPMLESLDCPVPSVKTPKRNITTTALQALSLMNNAFVQRRSKAFAERLSKEALDTASRVTRGFRLALGRDPDETELASSTSLAERHGLEIFCWGLFNASEFLYVH